MKETDYRVEIKPEYIRMSIFISRIKPNTKTNCWDWVGTKDKNGYGKYCPTYKGKGFNFRAHRVAWRMLCKEELKQGMVLDHICRNKSCVNPEHLRQVSYQINATENNVGPTAENKEKTHCINGHELPIKISKVKRTCLVCRLDRGRIHEMNRIEKKKAYYKANKEKYAARAIKYREERKLKEEKLNGTKTI